MTSSEDDLDLLERVFLRVGSASTDEQLESAINRFLIPVIVKLSNTNEDVRNKIMELLSHINKRVRRAPNVQLPVENLLNLYKDPEASSYLVNFSIVYIKLGYPRLPLEKKIELLPLLLSASGRKQKMHQDSLFFLLVSMVDHLKAPAESENSREFFKLDENPELMKNFCNYMLDVILLPYMPISQAVSYDSAPSGSQFFSPPAGMSESGYKRATCGDPPMIGERLEQTKCGILKFLSTGILPEADIICHFIIASSDTRFMVSDYAQDKVKQIASSVDWSNTALANRLFHIYLGTPEGPPDKKHPIPAANRVVPANTRMRLKLLPFFFRLEGRAILFPFNMQVIFDTLHSLNSNLKLQIHALNFAAVCVKRSDDIAFSRMGGMLYTGLLKLVLNNFESVQLRVLAYGVVGDIIKRMPGILNKRFADLQIFFANLNHERLEIRRAVRDALMAMIDSFRFFVTNVEVGMDGRCNSTEKMDLDSEEQEKINKELANRELMMIRFLASQIESGVPLARELAAVYLSAVFDTNHAPSRYLLLLAVGDSNPEVSSFALKALYTDVEWGEYKDKLIPLPEFTKMVECIYEQAKYRIQNPTQRVTIDDVIFPFTEVVFNEISIFLRLCMAQSSSVELTGKGDLFTHPCQHTPSIRRYILEAHAKNPRVFDSYLNLIEMLFISFGSAPAIRSLVEVVGTCPELFAHRLGPKFEKFMNLLGRTAEDVEDNIAFILSVVAVFTMDEKNLNETVRILREKLRDESERIQKGAILALGYIVQGKIAQSTRSGHVFKTESWPLHKEVFLELVKYLDDPDLLMISETCTALSQIIKSAPIPVPDNTQGTFSKNAFMRKLLAVAADTKTEPQIKEKVIYTCGVLCIGGPFPYSEQLLENLMDISKQAKDIETHLCIAQTVVLCLEGISSAEKRDIWKVDASDYLRPPIPERNLHLVNSLVNELVSQATINHQNFRQAISVFLLSILKNFHFVHSVRSRLLIFQSAFMELLSENNDIVQCIASRGLYFIYEITPPENRMDTATRLINQLLSGRRTMQIVSRDGRLYEEGQVNISLNGGNIPTYRELCSLASVLNQPDLIYKFIHLANQNTDWISERAAALGFHNIAVNAREEIEEYLPQIIPRLYRYQFDPTPKIQSTMSEIWNTLVPDKQKALKTYFHEILEDLAQRITSGQWRVRISGALALTDFFRADRSVLDALDKMPDLMSSVFRVMDDIHEGTRMAANGAATSIAKCFVTEFDEKKENIDGETLQLALSIFLPGTTSAVGEVRSVCLQTVAQLTETAGPTLKPSLPTLIVALLEAAGEMETIGLSFLTNHLHDNSRKQDIIDAVRANMTKTHYTLMTISKCAKYIELPMLDTLVPNTIEVLKNGRLGSRVACADFIVLLCRQFGKDMEKHTGKFLTALVNGLLDKNATLRKIFACAAGEIIGAARSASIRKLFDKLSKWYFEKENVATRTAIAWCLNSAARHNGVFLREYFPILIPLIFFAMHDKKGSREEKINVSMWEDVWNEISIGYETTLTQQFDEIYSILDEALISLSWTTKAQVGKCIQTLAVKLGENMNTRHRDKLIAMSLKALDGKTYKGKEEIVKGLTKLCTLAGPHFRETLVCQSIVEALLRESGKPKFGYRRHCVEGLGSVLETFDNMNFFQEVFELTQSVIPKLDEEAEEADILEDEDFEPDEKFLTLSAFYVCLGKSWPRNKTTQLLYQDILLDEFSNALRENPKEVQASILVALHDYIDKLHYFRAKTTLTEEEGSSLRNILQKILTALHYSFEVPKHPTLRTEALHVMAILAQKLIFIGRDEELRLLGEFFSSEINELQSDESPEVKTRVTHVEGILKR